MNKVDIVRKHIGNDDFYDMNGTSMLTNILNAMEEYKEQEVKNCSIPAVVGRSEQLKAFGKSLQYKGVRILTDEGVEQAVKDFERL